MELVSQSVILKINIPRGLRVKLLKLKTFRELNFVEKRKYVCNKLYRQVLSFLHIRLNRLPLTEKFTEFCFKTRCVLTIC